MVIMQGDNIEKFSIATCIYVFRMILTISSDYLPKRYIIGENDEEDVSSYTVTLRKRAYTGNRKRKR
jgi:hypothetical protein